MSIFKNKVIKNFSILTSTNLLIQILSILSSIRLARQLQPEGYGMFNLVVLQSTIFSIIAAYGLRIVVIRHIARNREDARKVFNVSNQIRLISTAIAIIIAFCYNLFLKEQALSSLLTVALLSLIIFQTFWDTIESIFFGYEKMETSGILNLIFTSIWIAEIYIIPNNYFTVSTMVMVYVSNQGIKSFVYYLWLKKSIFQHYPLVRCTGYSEHLLLIKQSNFFFILAIFSSIQNQMPILLLQFNSSVDQIGLFNLGNRILSPLQMMLSMLLTALFPMLSRLAVENKPLFAKRIKSLLNIIIVTGIWGSLCFALFSRDIVRILYGNAYVTSANVILIQCWFTILMAIFTTIGTVLSALDKEKLLSRLSIVYAVIAVPIFYIGTKYGATGLAWAFVIAGFTNMTYHWIIFRNLLQKRISIIYSLTIFASIGLLSIGTYFYKIDLLFIYRLGLGVILSTVLFLYIYKIEYIKLKSNYVI